MPGEDILRETPPPADLRVAYGTDRNQFLDVRLPHSKGPYPAICNIHGGFWRARYDLTHAGHLCEAIRKMGVATFNLEYRRVGDPGGGWPGTFDDIRAAFRFLQQQGERFSLDPNSIAVMGHSAGGQLALCLAARERAVRRAISLAGVLDLQRAFELHLSQDAVVEFLGGKPNAVPEHYAEADPMQLEITNAEQWILHGEKDDTVPVEFSRSFAQRKMQRRGTTPAEKINLVEIANAGHFDLIDPAAPAFEKVRAAVAAATR